MKKLLVSFSPNFIGIVKSLYATGEFEVVALHPQFAKMLNDVDVPSKSLNDLVTNEIRGAAFQYAAKVVAETVSGAPRVSMNGLPQSAVNFINNGNYSSYLYAKMTEMSVLVEALHQYSPDFILLHEDVSPIHRAVAMWAAANKATCLHVPHSIILPSPWITESGTDIHDLVTASHVAVSGPYQAEWFNERGAKNILVTGLPQLDKIVKAPKDKKQARRYLRLNNRKPVATFASSWRQDTNLLGCHDGIEEAYLKFLDMVKDANVQPIIKAHPNANNLKSHIEIAQEREVGGVFTAAHLEFVLAASDVVIAYGPSNLLIDAAHFPGLRLMSVEGFHDTPEVMTILEDDTPEQMKAKVNEVLSVPPVNMSRFLDKYAAYRDGLNAMRVTEVVKELCLNSS